MQLVKFSLLSIFLIFLISCIGPVKELQYQIEDSWEDTTLNTDNPSPLNDLVNAFDIKVLAKTSIGPNVLSNIISTTNFDDLFFSASHEGEIISLNQQDFSLSMKYKHPIKILAGLAYQNGKIYFVDEKGYLNAISIKGELEWKVFVGEVFSPPKTSRNSVIVKTTDNKFISSNLIDGSEQWKYIGSGSQLYIRSWGEISSDDETIFSGITSGKVIAINLLDGSLVWENTFSPPSGISDIERANDVTSKPIIDTSIVYVISSNGKIAALSKSEGSVLWTRLLSSFYGLLGDEDHLYLAHNTGSVYSLSKDTGDVIWRNTDLLGRDAKPCILYKDFLIVSDYEGYVHFLNKNTGKIYSRFKFSDSNVSTIISSQDNSVIFIFYKNGDIFKISTSDNLSNTNELEVNHNIIDSGNLESQTTKDNLINDDKSIIDSIIFWN